MTGIDDRPGDEVRDDTIEDLTESNALDDLQRMRPEMCDELNTTDNDRKSDLLEYRLDMLLEALVRVENGV